MTNSKKTLTSNVKKTSKKQAQTEAKAQTQKEKKQTLKNLEKFFDEGVKYNVIDGHVDKSTPSKKDFDEYLKLLDELDTKKAPKKLQLQTRTSPIYGIEKYSDDMSIKSISIYNLKQYKKQIIDKIEKLAEKKQKYNKYQNLVNLLDRQIQKNYFYLQTYSQQIFDLYFNSDTLTKYNYDLLHFDLLLKNESLNSQLLFYRLADMKKRYIDASLIIQNDDYIKGAVYDKTEKNIINKITNDIILTEIGKNDKIKLEFIKIYQKNLYKYNGQKQAMTISRYKKYIIDRYSYLLTD